MNTTNSTESYGSLPAGFEEMEIEAKFVVPDLQTHEVLKALRGQKLEDYRVLFRYEAMFVDTYYDTDAFDIFAKDGALRARRRYRDPQGKIPRDARFQSKDATTVIGAVFFRNEERGKRSKEAENWDRFLAGQLNPEAEDKAVTFIRSFAELGAKPLAPVLKISDVRFRLFLSKDYRLLYEISVDRLQFGGLTSAQRSQHVYECEVESVSEKTEGNVCELIRLSDQLTQLFAMTPSPESKYRRGIKAVVRDG